MYGSEENIILNNVKAKSGPAQAGCYHLILQGLLIMSANSKNPGQPAQMPRLTWVFAVPSLIFTQKRLVFSQD